MTRGSINYRRRLNIFRLCVMLVCGYFPLSSYGELVLDQHLSVPPQPGMMWRSPTVLPIGEPSPPSNTALPTTLAGLTDLGLRNNPSTREAWAAANAQAAAVGIAEAGYYPTLDLSVPLTRGKSSIISSSGVTTGTMQTRLAPSVTLSYVLFDFGARSANKQAASYGLLAANLSQNRALQDVVLRVEQAYYLLLGARQTVVAAEETLKNVQLSLDVSNARRRAGLATIGDVYQAETLLAQTRLQLRKAQGDTSKFKGALCNAVGLPVNAKLELAASGEQLPTQEVRYTISEYLSKAKAARPDLAAAEAQAQAAHASGDALSAQGLPTLNLAIIGGKTYNNVQNGFDNSATSGSVGITLNVPLFDGFRSTYTIRQARAHAEQLDATRDRVALQVELDVWQAYYDLDTAQAAIASAHALLRSASQTREVAQARYRAGVGAMPDLISAQANEANARMEVIQAEMGWYASLSQLNYSIGIFSSDTESK